MNFLLLSRANIYKQAKFLFDIKLRVFLFYGAGKTVGCLEQGTRQENPC